MSVRPSVRLSVCHIPVLYQNGLTCIILSSVDGSAIILVFPVLNIFCEIPTVSPTGALNTGGVYTFHDFLSVGPIPGCHRCFILVKNYPTLKFPVASATTGFSCASSTVKNFHKKFTVVTLCALLTRDQLAIAKFLVLSVKIFSSWTESHNYIYLK